MSDKGATRFFARQRWAEGSDEGYRDRMRAVWDAEAAGPGRQMRYSVYFDARQAVFGEAVMAIGSIPLADVRQKGEWPDSRKPARCGLAFTCDYQTWRNVLAALESVPVTRLNTYQNELSGDDRN